MTKRRTDKPVDRSPLLLLRRIEELQERIDRTTDPAERRRLIAEIKPLRAQQQCGGRKKSKHASLPKWLRDQMKEQREQAHDVSGFRRIRARFVQGGKGGG